jgi:MFS family permease
MPDRRRDTDVSVTAATECPDVPAGPPPLRRNRDFRRLWVGQALSGVGTSAAQIAYPLLILALTHSATIAGIAGTTRLAAQLALGLPGGVLSDRFDRRLIMIACDSVRAAALAVLAVLALAHLLAWPVVLVVSVVEGTASVLFDPSASAMLPGIVADEQLEQAWATTEARSYGAGLAGPALGGFLFGLGSAVPFLGDAVSYLVSVATLSRIRGSFRPRGTGKRRALWREAAEGIRLVAGNRLLRTVVIQVPLINFVFTGTSFTITLALREQGITPGVIGVVRAGVAAGGLLGALAAPKLVGRLPLQRLVLLLTTSATALFALAALILPSPWVAVPAAIPLFVAPVANAALFAAMLRTTAENLRGRVNSTVQLAAAGLAAPAPLIAGLLVQYFSGQWALAAFAAASGIAVVLCLAVPIGRTDG